MITKFRIDSLDKLIESLSDDDKSDSRKLWNVVVVKAFAEINEKFILIDNSISEEISTLNDELKSDIKKDLNVVYESMRKSSSDFDLKIQTFEKDTTKKIDDIRERFDRKLEEVKFEILKAIGQLNTEIAVLKTKSGLWGLAAGIAGTLGVYIASKLLGGK